MKRRTFIQNTALAGGLTMIDPAHLMAANRYNAKDFPIVRVPKGQRNFESHAIEKAIKEFSKKPILVSLRPIMHFLNIGENNKLGYIMNYMVCQQHQSDSLVCMVLHKYQKKVVIVGQWPFLGLLQRKENQ